jgi:predicted nucleic acid-binding protein
MLISNSSPLIHLTRLGKWKYVMRTFPSLVIPAAVRSETIEKGKEEGYRDALVLEKLEKEGWLKTVNLSVSSSLKTAKELCAELGRGEAEAIALAVEKSERLLIDDQKGRQIADYHGVETVTTLGLILEMLLNGALPREEYKKNIKNYSAQGWITPEVVQEFLDQGEKIE